MAKLIFVVEDDIYIRLDISEILETEGYDVKAFQNGKEAWDTMNDGNPLPDLILLDLMMPIMNGYEFLSKVNQEERLQQIAVIVMSANQQAQELPKEYINAVMSKPMDLEPFIRLIEKTVA